MNPQLYEHHNPSEESIINTPKQLEQRYNRFLCSLCFSPALKGFPYIKQALWFEHRNRHLLPSLTKEIYEEIAHRYQTQVCAVERCVTFSIGRAYKENPDAFLKLFPDCKKAPSNFRFIKTVSLYLDDSED